MGQARLSAGVTMELFLQFVEKQGCVTPINLVGEIDRPLLGARRTARLKIWIEDQLGINVKIPTGKGAEIYVNLDSREVIVSLISVFYLFRFGDISLTPVIPEKSLILVETPWTVPIGQNRHGSYFHKIKTMPNDRMRQYAPPKYRHLRAEFKRTTRFTVERHLLARPKKRRT